MFHLSGAARWGERREGPKETLSLWLQPTINICCVCDIKHDITHHLKNQFHITKFHITKNSYYQFIIQFTLALAPFVCSIQSNDNSQPCELQRATVYMYSIGLDWDQVLAQAAHYHQSDTTCQCSILALLHMCTYCTT